MLFYTFRIPLFSIFCIISSLLVNSCSSIPATSKKAGLEKPPAPSKVIAKRYNYSRINVKLEIKAAGKDSSTELYFARNVKKAFILLYHPEKGFIDTLNLNIVSSAQNDSIVEAALSINCMGAWENAGAIPYNLLIFEAHILTMKNQEYGFIDTLSLPAENPKQEPIAPVTMTCSAEIIDDTSATFVALVERQRKVQLEFFASSEILRAEILSTDGTVLWQSSVVKPELANTDVEPLIRNHVKRYEIQWDGKDKSGNLMPPGKYSVRLTLPVKPVEYSNTFSILWKQNK